MRSRVGLNLSLSSVLLGMMLLLHGPAYYYYTRHWGPDTDFYDIVVSAAGGADVLPTLDVALALGFFGVCAGMLLVDQLGGVTPGRWRAALRRWDTAPLRASRSEATRLGAASAMLALLLLLPFLVIDNQLPKILNFFALDLGEFEKIALRREGGGSESYLYNLLLSNVLPFLAFGLLALARARPAQLRTWSAVFVVLVVIGKAATLSKAPVSVFALQAVVVWLITRRLALSGRLLLGLGILATALFVVVSWVANPSADELLLVLDFLFYRVFMIVNESLLEYFAAIPYAIPHSWGTQISWIAGLANTTPTLPTFWLVSEVHRGVIGSTTTVMFLGDAWADFAWIGVAIVSFLVGVTVRWIDHGLIVRRGKSAASAAGLALGHYGIFIAMSTSFQTSLITGGLILVLPLVAAFGPRRPRPKSAAAVRPDALPGNSPIPANPTPAA